MKDFGLIFVEKLERDLDSGRFACQSRKILHGIPGSPSETDQRHSPESKVQEVVGNYPKVEKYCTGLREA